MSNIQEKREQETRSYVLDCNHTVYYKVSPRKRELLYCYRCQDWSRLTTGGVYKAPTSHDLSPVRWDLRCHDCSYERLDTNSTFAGSSGRSHSLRRKHLVSYAQVDGPAENTRWILCGFRLTPQETRLVLEAR